MRGEDLLEQRRAGARHAEDEDRFAAGGAVAGPLEEELARADPFLVRGVLFQQLRPVAALNALQRIAARVEAEGYVVDLAVLVGFAEREAQVVAVDRGGGRIR